jgi:RNA polymerase sigma-70 factor (ECF subfamily)
MKRHNSLCNQSESVVEHDRVYRAHKARIVGLCRLLLRDPDEAQDVAQEVFLRAFERLRTQEPPTVWEAWLVRVAINACRDRQRSGWWKSRGKNVELDEITAGSVPSSEAEALARERRTRIWQQLRRLKTKQRNVFVLRYVEGWSTSEVAEALGLSPGSVKTHLFRAVRHLRKVMES